jgi:hypothetical protein
MIMHTDAHACTMPARKHKNHADNQQGRTSAGAGIPQGLRVDGLYYQPSLPATASTSASASTSETIGESGRQLAAGTGPRQSMGGSDAGGGEGAGLDGDWEEQGGSVLVLSSMRGGGGDRVYFVVGTGNQAGA